ncbi:spermatogenesis-associated protein 20 isoform X2 [Sitodiplosis mosellana]|uniref:spermatogenesis-associated protein 20 isoform X2 n=1 Tax=Sitodiplosis mosellana TaxID=263140 RepID=UPI0024450C55|nr:spermatogenesis-associated protein 20 isoform X2 [Sitodiplosis mosellana]
MVFILCNLSQSHSSWPPKNHLDSSMSARTSTTAVLPDERKLEQHERLYASKPEQMNTNRLVGEKSPYLLQHAHNPVDWYPWGDEAIEKAKAENKVIFLSVGYSTCHWCHVMEKESFENPEVAAIMNRHFVNIKVDREERPDIDKIYMQFVLMVSGSGGWPMSVWLTPDLTPITAGTYFPPKDRWGMSGFVTVLEKIAEMWREKGDELVLRGHKIIDLIDKSAKGGESSEQPSQEDFYSNTEQRFNEIVKIYDQNIDNVWGGFGGQTKFPEVSKLNLAFHAHVHKPESDMARHALMTLKNIANGGIHDHVYGGFCRYSVDRQWHVPHFEKMLYDQGQLLTAYVNAYKMTKDPFYLDVADKIYEYLVTDLRHPNGGFFSGEDADSYRQHGDEEKVEGAFYAWTQDEVQMLFSENSEQFSDAAKALDIYCHFYGITDEGNVQPSSDPHGHLLGRNILRVRTSIEETARKHGVDTELVKDTLQKGNKILYIERCKRPRPHLDTKIITAWNGLALSGLSALATIKDAPRRKEYIETAQALVNFLRKYSFRENEKTLIRSCYGEGVKDATLSLLEQPIEGFLDDYSFLIKGLIDFYVATLDIDALKWAKQLQDTQDRLFWDSEQGGYFYSQANSANVIVRLKEDHDGAEPCGNSVAARNLPLISAYFHDKTYKERACKLLSFFSSTTPFGYALPEMFSAQMMRADSLAMMVVVGPKSDALDKLCDTARDFYIPGLLLMHYDPEQPSEMLTRPAISKFKMVRNEPTVYLCHNRVCQLPITTADDFNRVLTEKYASATLRE